MVHGTGSQGREKEEGSLVDVELMESKPTGVSHGNKNNISYQSHTTESNHECKSQEAIHATASLIG